MRGDGTRVWRALLGMCLTPLRSCTWKRTRGNARALGKNLWTVSVCPPVLQNGKRWLLADSQCNFKTKKRHWLSIHAAMERLVNRFFVNRAFKIFLRCPWAISKRTSATRVAVPEVLGSSVSAYFYLFKINADRHRLFTQRATTPIGFWNHSSTSFLLPW